MKSDARFNRLSMRKQGRWPAGRTPYGYQLHLRDFNGSDGYTLIEDPEAAKQLREIIDAVLSGKSFVQIAKDLNERGVLTPRNHTRKPKDRRPAEWSPQTITKMLRSVSLLGQQKHNGQVVTDNGVPVQFGPPLIQWGTWTRLQAELDSRARPINRRRDTPSLLLGFAFCANCGSRLHLSKGGSGKYRRNTYRCVNYRDGKCPVGPMYANNLEEFVRETLIFKIGDETVPEVEVIPGQDYTEELDKAENSLALLLADRERGLFQSRAGARIFDERIREIEAVIREYENKPVIPERIVFNETDRTVSEVWEDGTPEEIRGMLEHLPYRVLVGPAVHKGSRDWWSRCRLTSKENT